MKIKEKENWLMPKNWKDGSSNTYKVIELDNKKTISGQEWPVFKVMPLDDPNAEYHLSGWALQAYKGEEPDIKVNSTIEITKFASNQTRFYVRLVKEVEYIKISDPRLH